MDQICGKTFAISFLRVGKYEHQVNDLQKHMKAVAWGNPSSITPANHFSRTGWHKHEQWSHPMFASSHATPATTGEEGVPALSKETGYLCTAAVYLSLQKVHKATGFKVASATATATLELSPYTRDSFLRSCSSLLGVSHQTLFYPAFILWFKHLLRKRLARIYCYINLLLSLTPSRKMRNTHVVPPKQRTIKH